MQTREKSWIGGALAAIALVFLVAVAVGIGYEQVQRRRDRDRFPQVGRSVDIGGRTLNIYCSGEGSPAVVLESDALKPGYSWLVIQREIAQVTRVCWYDRAGYGWSDPGPAPHTSRVASMDLHELLRNVGLRPPYLLVGDGFGSLNARVYNGLYPDDVAGLVLVDPIQEDEERMGFASRVPFHLGYPPDLVLRTASRIGVMRLMAHGERRGLVPKGFTPAELAILSGLLREPKMKAAFLAEQGFSTSIEEVRSAGSLGNRALAVLHSRNSFEADSGPRGEPSKLARLSTRGREVVVGESARNILNETPDAVVATVRDLVAELRRKP